MNSDLKQRVLDFTKLSNRNQYNEWEAELQSLVQVGAPPFIELLEVTCDSERPIKWAVTLILGRIGDPVAVEPLCQLLFDRFISVRRGAAWALDCIGDTRAVEDLIQVLRIDRDPMVIQQTSSALAHLGDTRAVEPLKAVLSGIRAKRWGGVHTRQVVEAALKRFSEANTEKEP